MPSKEVILSKIVFLLVHVSLPSTLITPAKRSGTDHYLLEDGGEARVLQGNLNAVRHLQNTPIALEIKVVLLQETADSKVTLETTLLPQLQVLVSSLERWS